jgi:inorganic pyrophosphatase
MIGLRETITQLRPWAARDIAHVIIDTPAGSRNKYKFDRGSGLFMLSRILPEGLHFPCEFGSIPGTQGEDGDALDIAVLGIEPSFVGCLMSVRPLGVIKAVQWERRRRVQNDRLIAVPVTPVNRPAANHLADIDKQRLADLENFFRSYNRAQGRRFEIRGRRGRQEALRLIRASVIPRDAASVANRGFDALP